MSYISQLSKIGSAIGTPPKVQPKAIGTVPGHVPAQAHIEPPPYDVAMDPGWHGILDPSDHELRNFLNGLAPEERQMLLVRLGKAGPQAPTAAAAPAAAPSPLAV